MALIGVSQIFNVGISWTVFLELFGAGGQAVVDRIQFCAVVELRTPLSCWLPTRGGSQFHGDPHGSLPLAPQNLEATSSKPEGESLQSAKTEPKLI